MTIQINGPSLPREQGFDLFADFFINSSEFLASNTTGTGASTGTTNPAAGTELGVLVLTMGTTATGRASMRSSAAAGIFRAAASEIALMAAAKVQIPTLDDGAETFSFAFGFIDSDTTLDSTDGIYFKHERAISATNWVAVTANNGTLTKVDTGVAIGAGFKRLRIELGDGSQEPAVAYFLVDDVLCATISTNIPTGSGRSFGIGAMTLKSAGLVSRTVNIDWMRFVGNLTKPRSLT